MSDSHNTPRGRLGDSPNVDPRPIVHCRDGMVFADSRDVAAYFERRHPDVLRAIDNLLTEDASLAPRTFAQGYYELRNTGAQRHRMYDMDEEGFSLLAMGFTGGKALRWKRKYIAAFRAMAAQIGVQPSPPVADPLVILNDPAAMRGLLLTYADKVLALEADKAALEPKAAAHDRIAELRGTFTRTAAAKILGVPPNVLMTWMANNGWTYTRTGGTDVLAHQAKLNAGLLENKIAEGRDGATWRKINVHVTPKGLTVLAKAFPPLLQIAGAA